MQGEVTISRPIETVFDFVADARNEPLYNENVLQADKLSPEPVGHGSRFRTLTKGIGRRAEWIIEITEYERPRRLGTSIHTATTDISGSQVFDEVDGGTRMKWSWELEPKGLFKLMGPLIKLLGQPFEERNWRKLKRYLERPEPPGQ
jgi:hypothetical protein